jgi:hypothetical protein
MYLGVNRGSALPEPQTARQTLEIGGRHREQQVMERFVHTASAIASGAKRYRPKVLRKASVLPITFLGTRSSRVGGDCGVGGGGYSVVGSVRGVTGNVDGRGSVSGGTGGGAGRTSIGVAGGGVGGKCGGARLARRNLTPHPRTPRFEGIPRSVVFRALIFEIWDYVLGAVGGPEHQRLVVPLVEPHFSSSIASAAFDRVGDR